MLRYQISAYLLEIGRISEKVISMFDCLRYAGFKQLTYHTLCVVYHGDVFDLCYIQCFFENLADNIDYVTIGLNM